MRIEARVWWLSAGAALLYGLVALWVNHSHGSGAMLRAAVAQGLSSAITTFTLSAMIDHGHERLARHAPPSWPASAAVGAVAVGVATLQHLALNLLARTPELVATVTLPVLAAVVYSFIYAVAARRRLAAAAASAGA